MNPLPEQDRGNPPPLPPPLLPIPEKFGGWLILPLLGLVLSPCLLIKRVVESINQFLGDTTAVVEQVYPGFKIYFVGEILLNLFLLAFVLVVAVKFFRKKQSLPVWMIALLGARLGVAMLDYLAGMLVFHGEIAGATAIGTTQIISTGLVAAIWIPYFLKSDRVALTFVIYG